MSTNEPDRQIIITGGTQRRWFCIGHINKMLGLSLNNQEYMHALGAELFFDSWHTVICSFDLINKRIYTMYDGKFLGDITLDDDFTLYANADQSDYDKNFSFTNYSTGGTFYGYVDNFKVYSCALSKSQIQDLSDGISLELSPYIANYDDPAQNDAGQNTDDDDNDDAGCFIMSLI